MLATNRLVASYRICIWICTLAALSMAPLESYCDDKNAFEEIQQQAEALMKVFALDAQADNQTEGEQLHPWDYFILDILPTVFNQRPNNENGTESQFKEYLMSDESNDDAWLLSSAELIERSGFRYELHDAIADDGYVTTMTRIVNPLADRHYLRYPPVILEHGGTIDPTAYILASSIQHHPEKWPRSAEDGPITSWNRSLAFVLANNGFDVWLAETRGSNDGNKRKIPAQAVRSVLRNRNANKNMSSAESINQILEANNYWSFSQDDIIAHELKSHIDTVLRVTGANHVSLLTFSLSTPTSLAFLSLREDYAAKIQGYVSMAPIVSGQGVNLFLKHALLNVCPLIPDDVGFRTFTDMIFSQSMRDLIVFLAQNKHFRYSWLKMVISILVGPSAKWKTLLDLNLLGHMMRQLSFREAKQLCQQMSSNKLQKYDHGPIKNKLLYNQTEPPEYNLTNLHIKDWIVVAATNDALSTIPILDHLLSLVNPKPIATVLAPGFNHLDLIAAVDNDKYVNLPILAYFQSKSYVPGLDEYDEREAEASSVDLSQLLPKIPALDTKSTSAGSNTTSTPNPLDLGKLFEDFSKNLASVLSGLSAFDKLIKMFDPNSKTDSKQ